MRYIFLRFIQIIMILGACLALFKAYSIINTNKEIKEVAKEIPLMNSTQVDIYQRLKYHPMDVINSGIDNGELLEGQDNTDTVMVVEDPFSRGQVSAYLTTSDIRGVHRPGNLEIPKLNISEPIYIGTSESILSIGLGLMTGTDIPSANKGTSSVIAGHRGYFGVGELFLNVDKLEIDDEIIVHTSNQKLTYKVTGKKIVSPYDVASIPNSREESTLTLVTCTPMYLWTDRLLVYSTLVNVE